MWSNHPMAFSIPPLWHEYLVALREPKLKEQKAPTILVRKSRLKKHMPSSRKA